MGDGRDVHSGYKGGDDIGKTKCGKGRKLEVIADAQGLPLGVAVAAANVAETALVQPALPDVPVALPAQTPLVADRGYDSDELRDRMDHRQLPLLCPHRRNRRRPSRNDGRRMRRYRRRYVIERTNSWLHYFRRLAKRWEHYTFMDFGFFRVAGILLAFARF
jgi:IS5 family transposase